MHGLHLPDPRCGPPDGADAWLADLPAELLFEYIAATEDPPCREAIVAGRLPRQPADGWQPGDGCGFAAGGVADELPPGPVLARFAGDAWTTGLGRLSDDELIGVLRAARRLASWSAALTLTARAADVLLDLATALRRLPATMAALAAGRIDRHRAAVIAEELAGLGEEHAAAVEQQVLDHAPGETTGQLRAAARRAVLATDPAAARERKERAARDARVERWDEHADTAALAGRDLPPADVLAADHHLSALAGSLRQAGVGGTMDQLRAHVYLALLTGQPLTALTGREAPGACEHRPLGAVNLTMPLATWLGLSDAPGHAAGYGPLDASDSCDLAARLAGQPGSRWCITLTGEDGRPVAHGCARTGRGPSGRSRPLRGALRQAGDLPDARLGAAHLPATPPLPQAGRPTPTARRLTSASGRPASTGGGPTSPAGWRASLSAGWRRVIAAICGSRPPTGRRPGCGT